MQTGSALRICSMDSVVTPLPPDLFTYDPSSQGLSISLKSVKHSFRVTGRQNQVLGDSEEPFFRTGCLAGTLLTEVTWQDSHGEVPLQGHLRLKA